MKSDIRIFKDSEKLSQHAAMIFTEQAAQAINDRNHLLVARDGRK